MGVRDLWGHIKQFRKTCSMIEWTSAKRDKLGGQIPRIGIDANNLLTSLLVSSFNTTHMNGNDAIGNLLSTLCRYSCGQAVLIFVFDGPRASYYKTSNVPIGSIPFHEEAKILIRAFGGYILEVSSAPGLTFAIAHTSWWTTLKYIQAPAEADAQLSWMMDKGILDAVISEDSDMIYLLVSSEQTAEDNHQEIFFDEYTFTDLKHSECHLTRGGLLLVALLVGNDYANGIDGCGVVTAIQLASCGLGDTLRNGYLSICSDPVSSETATLQSRLCRFYMNWREHLCKELATNSAGKLTRRLPSLVNKIEGDTSFPATDALRGYLQQEVTHIPMSSRVDTRKPFATEPFMHGGVPRNHVRSPFWSTNPSYGPQPISVEHVTRFCAVRMHLDPERVLSYFHKYLWKPVVMQMYISPFLSCDSIQLTTGTPAEIRLHGFYKVGIDSTLAPLKTQPNTHVRVRYNTEGLRTIVVSTLSSINPEVNIHPRPGQEKAVIHHKKRAMPWVYQLNLPHLDADSDNDDSEVKYLYTRRGGVIRKGD
ncbi:hypothetical protein AAF712_009975 [Marasmius tenuissimus]|uniref:XPG-I domain-containing protein n=1 Tax=Marasmius tenuissimus TaxID=585030 RepID=A0ABR2ZNS4_9AGAR